MRPRPIPWVNTPPQPCGLTGRETLQPHTSPLTQGIDLRPKPWAPFSRPVGPGGLAARDKSRLAFAVAEITDAIEQAIGPAPEDAEHPDRD